MSSYIYASEKVDEDTRERVESVLESRTGTEPSVVDEDGYYIVSSREEIDQGRYKVAFNGYITDTDSPEELIAQLYDEHGFDFVERLNGQFRLVIYDTEEETFYTAADKVGKKVVYRAEQGDNFIISSHLTPLIAHSGFEVKLDEQGISDFLQSWSASFGGGNRLIEDVKRLYPSHYLEYDGDRSRTEKFWEVYNSRRDISDTKAADRADELLTEAAEKLVERCEGDLNVFLSGGFDSTFLVSLLREVTDREINTYTWGWKDEHFESAREMSKKYGTNHHEIINDHSLPSDEEIFFYEEPQNAFLRYPFRELFKEEGMKNYWTGLNSQVTFPVCLGNVRKLDRVSTFRPVFQTSPGVRKLSQIASGLNYKASKALDVMESDYRSTSAVVDWGANRYEGEKLTKKLDAEKIDRTLDEKWGLEDKTFQENYNYLQLRTRDSARYAYYSQDMEHFDVYGYEPLVEFICSLPMRQKKNRRMLQKIARGRVPDRIITKGASGWEFVSEQFLEMIRRNEEEFRSTVRDLCEREFMDEKAAEEVLLADSFENEKGRVNLLISAYLFERWLKLFIDTDRPWEKFA